MKKILIVAVSLLCLGGTAVAQRHIEFGWRGFYATGDASYVFNLNRSVNAENYADTLSAFMPSFSCGFQFRKEAAVGAGFGYLADPNGAYTQLPLFVELRSHFMRSQLTPYSVLQIGYTLPVGASSEPPRIKIEEGGLYVALEVGARYAFTRSTALAAHVGYRMFQSNSVQRENLAHEPMLASDVVLHCISGGLTFYFSNK